MKETNEIQYSLRGESFLICIFSYILHELIDILTMSNQDSNSNSPDGSDNESNESETEAPTVEPLATTRSRRTNAGNLMSKMIQDEEDEFYSNLYGGFNEEDDDMDFDEEEEANDEDVEGDYDVDSDFSIDETDEIAPQHQLVDEEPKKRRGAYKDPKPKGHSSTSAGSFMGTIELSSGASAPATGPATTTSTPKPKLAHSPGKNRGERSFRDSTRKKTEETIKNIQTGTRKKKKKLRNAEAWRPLTQEEMLAEAKLTEEQNLKSLETYQRIESEKLKKIKQVKKTLPVPYVTYFSTTMPVLKKDELIKSPIVKTDERYSRNFITYVT